MERPDEGERVLDLFLDVFLSAEAEEEEDGVCLGRFLVEECETPAEP